MTKKEVVPYHCRRESESKRIVYEFETDQKVRYMAYFSDYSYMFGAYSFGCEFYSFDLIVLDGVRPPKFTVTDPRIAETVRHCFVDIFQSLTNVVIAVYDSSDKNEQARRRKFNRWFNEATIDSIEKVDFEVDAEDYVLLSSVFLSSTLLHKEAVLDRYQQILENGNIPLDEE